MNLQVDEFEAGLLPYKSAVSTRTFSFGEINEMMVWCKENLRGRWGFISSTVQFGFDREPEANLFSLFWKYAKVVIGSHFGDEGKGLFVDYLARHGSLVVRHSGAAQAGHTVQLANGYHHVFHHIGSGSFQGAETLLSRHFISNPMLFNSEYYNISELDVRPNVMADPRGLVSTHYDMMLNQWAEEARGDTRHGSCGVGVNETIKRSEHPEFRFTIDDALTWSSVKTTLLLKKIQTEWVPERIKALGLAPNEIWQNRLENENILLVYMENLKKFGNVVKLIPDIEYLNFDSIVFEGAQGLLLDENHRFFPHVTHSNTGLKNVIELATESNIKELEVYYMTRAYATRHGAGPFPHEDANLSYVDKTNVPNEWQGSLRFGYLDLDLMAESINNDLLHADGSGISIKARIVVTCLDQVGDEVKYYEDNEAHTTSQIGFLKAIERKTGLFISHVSYGPTREDIREFVDA
jgi:adenylosuccinate synthase